MGVDLLNCAIEDLGLARGDFNIPFQDLNAIPGDGSLSDKRLSMVSTYLVNVL
jgi:hypothetical protein